MAALEPEIVQNQTGSMQSADTVAADVIKTGMDFAVGLLGQSILKRNIHNYNGANLAYNHASDTANKLGMSDEQKQRLAPFPQIPGNTTVNVNSNQPQPEKPSPPPAKGAKALPLLLAAALGAGGAGLGYLLTRPSPPVPVVVQPEEPHDHNPGVGLDVK
jgi:hypothetical protein